MPETQSIYPTFRYRDAEAMIDWLRDAFGFTVGAKFMNGNVVGHAELSLGGSTIMLGEARADAFGGLVGAPGEQGGKSIYVAIEDVDRVHATARAAGATMLEPMTERSYGSREFICADPQGNVWCFGTYRPGAAA